MEVLCLELTCKFFRNIFISDRVFWLRRLHALEQDEAPNLPRHIPISTLTLAKLRSLVESAHRRHLKYTNSAPLQPTREEKVSIRCLDPTRMNPHLLRRELLPGGELFLDGSSQYELCCYNVLDNKCIWIHRPDDDTEHSGNPTQHDVHKDTPRVQSFGCDMQANGDVLVLVVGTSPGNSRDKMFITLKIFQISPHMDLKPDRLPVPVHYSEKIEIPWLLVDRSNRSALDVLERRTLYCNCWVCFRQCRPGRQLSHLRAR
ncbi:hypothetical protein DFH11DRAFT_1626144 [Phellopilus nigrolimitatus]|nr:hypothetical protein DFH11DRAFT_1626144 [Phellopilus nigrolimitatus]